MDLYFNSVGWDMILATLLDSIVRQAFSVGVVRVRVRVGVGVGVRVRVRVRQAFSVGVVEFGHGVTEVSVGVVEHVITVDGLGFR
jgi:hypothetical protein